MISRLSTITFLILLILLPTSLVEAQEPDSLQTTPAAFEVTPELTPEVTPELSIPIDASFSAELTTVLTGELILLTLRAEIPREIETVEWPKFLEEWSPFLVTDVGDLRITEGEEYNLYEQKLTVILWEPGQYQTPETTITVESPDSGELVHARVEPVRIDVPTVLDGVSFEMRPFAPPIWFFYISPWIVLVGSVALMSSVYLAWRRYRSRPLPIPAPEAPLSASQKTLMSLQNIAAQDLPAAIVYQAVADSLRLFLQHQFDIATTEMTTAELMRMLRVHTPISDRRRRELRYLLEHADLVKFARLQPPPQSGRRLLRVAAGWVESVAPPANHGEISA